MLAALLVPRFAFAVTARRQGGIDPAVAAALGPEPGSQPIIGEPSAAAEAAGVRAGMRLTEALALCPGLALLPPDPIAVETAGETLLQRLEAIGAAVEPVAPGCALFAVGPIERLYGGLQGVLRTAAGVVPAALRPRLGAAPGRFPALAAARRARSGRPLVLRPDAVREALAPLPVTSLSAHAGIDPLVVRTLETLGVARLGGLAALDRLHVRDRFGPEGLRAWRLSRGDDPARLAPRPPVQALVESLELPDAVATEQALDHALRVLVERLLARPERRGREPRTVRLMARLVGGGSWERTTPLREPTADRDRLLLALIAKLRLLPAPADELAVELGDLAPGDRQQPLFREEGAMRAARLEAAARQVRAAVGDTSALRIVEIDGASRLPERRFGLVPR
jgi:protein ImuB